MAEAAHDLWHRRRIVVFGHQPNRLPWDFASDGLSRSQASVYFFLKRSCVLLNRVRKTARDVHYVVVGSSLPSLPGSSDRRFGQQRRDPTSFGPITTTNGLVTLPDVRCGGWVGAHDERLHGAVDIISMFFCFGGRTGSGGGVVGALAATVVCFQ